MMEIGDIGIKSIEDIETAIKEYCGDEWDAAEILKSACIQYGERFFGLLCEIAAKKILGEKK